MWKIGVSWLVERNDNDQVGSAIATENFLVEAESFDHAADLVYKAFTSEIPYMDCATVDVVTLMGHEVESVYSLDEEEPLMDPEDFAEYLYEAILSNSGFQTKTMGI